jgi:acyl-CoA dehydrogenase
VTYHAPISDMSFALKYSTGLTQALGEGFFGDLSMDDFEAVLTEAGRVAGEIIAPINQVGDRTGATFKDGAVTTAPGWKNAYDTWRKGGWNGLTAPTEWGGQALPHVLNAACVEMWNAASMAFAVGPLVGMSAIDAFTTHGSEELKRVYLPKLVSGEWIATMQLTEPHAGSDVGALRTRADRAPDGTYRIKGQKIFITYGEHDLTENIIHFVLARLPDAPPGTRGISLFLVPKYLVNTDGSLGARNDVRAHSIEHKLGIHGSPTCTMIFGDHDGATGFIVGEENAGMACMFTMMNRARLAVGLQGVGIAERAIQLAVAYARERRQGRTAGMAATESAPIGAHPDVKRMLMSMRSFTQAARTICYLTALAIDRAERASSETERRDAHARASLLTPVAKAFSTDIGVEVASLGVQVHGGMGYIEETGAAQLFRDARIATIYEGTNGIQAIDLVTRKLPLAGGVVVEAFLGELRAIVEAVNATNDPALGWSGLRLEEAVESLTRTTHWMLAHVEKDTNEALAGATPYLRLFGLATGGCLLAQQALAALRLNSNAAPRVALARFFAENFVVQAEALERTIVEGAPGLLAADPASLQ